MVVKVAHKSLHGTTHPRRPETPLEMFRVPFGRRGYAALRQQTFLTTDVFTIRDSVADDYGLERPDLREDHVQFLARCQTRDNVADALQQGLEGLQ